MLSTIIAMIFSGYVLYSKMPVMIHVKPVEVVEEVETEVEKTTYDNIELLAMVCMAEAEGESELGKRLVIDAILNRVDSDRYPNTVEEVIYQKDQFSCMWNGRINRCYVNNDILQLIDEEIQNRVNDEVVFFCAGGYSAYGVPVLNEGNHYFSKYN